ncbi:MAG TPA: LuxR family transcriptional regulator [Streptosporangiaceae bacterium]|nr:LuxR family transcriptional regulator [Streptosporangiaceae bacterium]
MAELVGRRHECAALDRLVADVLAGTSRVLVLRGEAGVGKSALLGYLSDRVAVEAGRGGEWRVTSAVGVESEMELAYSGLHQLCVPLLDHLDELPNPQRDALATVYGLSSGPAPDRFLVGLAALTLVAQAAGQRPLACIIDDAQWLDQASAQIFGFVARRLLAERVALVCAARTGIGDDVLAGLPALEIRGLSDGDARPLLLGSVHGPLDVPVADRILAESHGNPLALLELPRTWQPADLAGGFGLPGSRPVASKIEHSYIQRLRLLPADTQLLLLTAAAEPLGDPVLLRRAAGALGIEMAAAVPAVDAGLFQVGRRVEFAHPLVRSAAYHAAAAPDRHRAHHALADVTDAQADPDRRAWHRARATSGPDEEVAAELERSADRAQARGGVAAAAAFLQRSVELTVDPARRAERTLAAAQASFRAGAFEAALGLLATAEAGLLDEFQRARVDLVRGQLAFASGVASDAPPLLLDAARGLEPFDLELARETYLTAWGAASVATGQPAGRGVLLEICRAVRALPPRPGAPRPLDLLLEGLALLTTDGHAAATPTLQRAATALADIPVEDVLRWGWMATAASNAVWDNDGAHAISARQVQLIRDAGALAELPLYLSALGLASAWMGDFAGAASNIAEADSVAAATGSHFAPYALLRVQALQGREAEASAAIEHAAAGGPSAALYAQWAAAVLYNGLARYQEAAASARQATSNTFEYWVSVWALPELVEAAVRAGEVELARDALGRLAETTQPAGTDFALGLEARSRALVTSGDRADLLYRSAIERLGRSEIPPELARAHLLYGEWLRRANRRADARSELARAHEMFTAMGMDGFAERTRRELLATGATVGRRTAETHDQLTPQEAQIAQLARAGLSNPEIAAQVFLSVRTVEWHLRKVFTKLGISSRGQLRRALADRGRPLPTA